MKTAKSLQQRNVMPDCFARTLAVAKGCAIIIQVIKASVKKRAEEQLHLASSVSLKRKEMTKY